MFTHCEKTFCHSDILYLFDNKDYFDRRIFIGSCPICKKTFAKIVEVSRATSQKKTKIYIGINADKYIEKHLFEINFTYRQVRQKRIKIRNPLPRGLRYGENIQYKNGTIKRFAVSLTGNCSKEDVT